MDTDQELGAREPFDLEANDAIRARLAQIDASLRARHTCEGTLKLRLRTVAGGAQHVVRQCAVCGYQRGGPLGKEAAARELAGQPAALFDETIVDRRRAELGAILEEARVLKKQLLEAEDPELAAWQDATDAERAAHSAAVEKALIAVDAAVAQLNIMPREHRLGALLRRLQKRSPELFTDPGLRPCGFENETELRSWLEGWLSADFEVFPEVVGRHLTENVRVKIDYVIRPRPHLLAAGFKPGSIGLEAKLLPVPGGGFSPRASRFVWQAVSYTDCLFELEGQSIRLPRVLIFSNLAFEDEERLLRGIDHSPIANDRAKWRALLELANHANVGSLQVYGSRADHKGWHIRFAAGLYFARYGREFRLSDAHLFEKVRIGNF